MKKVVKGLELEEKMNEAIDLLCDTVKSTLGPIGTNAIIDHSLFTPFITNDGVTIAQNIMSEDEVVNTILEIAKESSIKTNDTVGDGTTTTLVLLQSIYKEGKKLIASGVKPINIQKSLANSYACLEKNLTELAQKPSNEKLQNIAITSANDVLIGSLVSEAFLKTEKKEAITIQETEEETCYLIYKKGYTIDYLEASNYYFQETKEIELNQSYFLILNNPLNSLEDISFIIEDMLKSNKSLLILAEDYSNDLINEALSLYLDGSLKIYLVKIPGYGLDKITILKDLELITSAHIVDNSSIITWQDIGIIDAKFTSKDLTFTFLPNSKIDKQIKKLESTLNKDEFLNKRLAMLKGGLATIMVGAKTATERREKKMRFDDALGAISASLKGIVLGSGIPFYQISELLKEEEIAYTILKKSLKAPLEQILTNAGLNPQEIITKLKENNFKKIYNVLTEQWEDKESTNVVDALEVVLNSLANAISIAGMLLTTDSLIINEHQNNLSDKHEYTEF